MGNFKSIPDTELFLFLLGLIFRGKKFLNDYSKLFTSPVLILGIFGILYSTGNEDKPIPSYRGLATMETILVSKNLSNKIQLHVVRDEETGRIFQEGSFSFIQGFVLGLKWRHFSVTSNVSSLEVSGSWEWYLIGNQVYRSFETYQIGNNDLPIN